jgi:peptidoglycan/xylan/chitin deacetylase (PgdA/CDA1 family)
MSSGVLRRGLKAGLAAVDSVRRPPRGLVILAYHRVGAGTDVEVDLDVGRFDEQLAYLAEHHEVLGIDGAVDALARGDDLAGAVVVTFDDGTADVVERALPVAERHQVPLCLYVATEHVEGSVPFPAGGRPVSWAALADGMASGWLTIGSHTHGHLLLDRVTPEEAAADLDRSIELIGSRLGTVVRHFAYPKAKPAAPAVRPIVAERFRSAAVAGTRPNPPGTDPLALARSPIQRSDGMRFFRHKVRGGLGAEDDLRVLLDRRRHAGART